MPESMVHDTQLGDEPAFVDAAKLIKEDPGGLALEFKFRTAAQRLSL